MFIKKLYKNATTKQKIIGIYLLLSNIMCVLLLVNFILLKSVQVEEHNNYISLIKEMFINHPFDEISSFENDDFIVTAVDVAKSDLNVNKRITVIDKKTDSMKDTTELIISNLSPSKIIVSKMGEPSYSNAYLFFNVMFSYFGLILAESLLSFFIFSFDKTFGIMFTKMLFLMGGFAIVVGFPTISVPIVLLISFITYFYIISKMYFCSNI